MLGRLGRTLLLSTEGHCWQGPDKSSLRLAQLVQTLHINADFTGNTLAASDVIRILSTCTNIRMVSVRVWLDEHNNKLISALEELEHLSMLSWRGRAYAHQIHPLFFCRLPTRLERLESLVLHCEFEEISTNQQRSSSEINIQLRDAFPRLRSFAITYNSSQQDPVTRDNTMRDLKFCLVRLLERSPDIASVAIRAGLTADQMATTLPAFLVNRLHRLSLSGTGIFAEAFNSIDVRRLPPFTKLNSLSISDILQPDAWSSLPVELNVLELRLGAVGDFDRLIQFLAVKENLPSLRSLRVDITKTDPVRQALDDNAAVGLLVLEWNRLREACNARGVQLRPGAWISRWRAIQC